MDDEGVSGSHLLTFEKKAESFYPMFFGVSCALFALKQLSESEVNDEKWLDIKNRMLQGSAHLLGLLVWRVQREEVSIEKRELLHKLAKAEKEIKDLKKRRSEDAKANEKVLGIFAAHEQGWFVERKKLRQQIGSLLNELRVLESNKNEAISKLNEQVLEKEILVKSKDKELEEIEEKLKRAENEAEEARENAKREAQGHSNELWKHKTAFIELVSTQRQFEAEMGRAVRQVEETKRELDLVLEQKEESLLMTQKLSFEVVKVRRDLEQKDKILSAMLRKSKLDTAEKQMLLKEVKLSKDKRKQAELESERWRAVSEARHERHSLRSMLSKHAKSKHEGTSSGRVVLSNAIVPSDLGKTRSLPTDLLEYDQPVLRRETEVFSPLSEQYMTARSDDSVFAADLKKLEGWVRSEAEKYANAVDQRHHLEIDAFTEQLRLKDEKLEAYQWRLMSFEIESKRLKSHIEGLDHNLSQLKQENVKMEALLLDQEAELHSLKTQLSLHSNPPYLQKANIKSSSHDLAIAHDTVWSKVKIIKRKPGEREQETDSFVEICQEVDNEKDEETRINLSKDIVFNVQTPEKEFGEEKDIALDPGSIQEELENVKKLSSSKDCLATKTSLPWKMDLHALGVSYKIKRLKQQLVMFERLRGKQESVEDGENSDNGQFGMKGFYTLMSLLNKQVSRYTSLQGNIDDLCKRMHENDLVVDHGGAGGARTKAESKMLEQFLTETFHLQRYIVATGQKLMEIQSKIGSVFVGAAEELEGQASFDTKVFSESLRTLFREVQRGVEVRIARIIGDLEGTLACEGMVHLRR